jgi:hypothetical protein
MHLALTYVFLYDIKQTQNIVYDIQDEAGRTSLERPFPFR